jgi:hypothetical protein
LQDGAWTEEPVDGAYTQIGYEKEFKPFTRYTHILEGIPSKGVSQRGAVTEIGIRGAWTEPPVRGAYTQDDAYEKEIKPINRTYNKEGLPQ